MAGHRDLPAAGGGVHRRRNRVGPWSHDGSAVPFAETVTLPAYRRVQDAVALSRARPCQYGQNRWYSRNFDPGGYFVEHMFRTIALKVLTAVAALEVALDHTGRETNSRPFVLATLVVVSAPTADAYLYLRSRRREDEARLLARQVSE